MSIFKDILNKIFHRDDNQQQAPQMAPASEVAPPPMPSGAEAAAGGIAVQSAATSEAAAAMAPVDVEAVLNGIAAQSKQKLNWRTSIVDLMKLLDLDSSLQARKALATELGYKGALDGSSEMNTWLHRQVMTKLAQNGGKVPAELRD
jgi:3-oxoacyl-ACP reductase-like protein